MGSTRVVFQKQGDSVYIVQAIQYSPTGVLLSELGSEPTLLTHLFQGKEWIDGFGYDFITRTYDPYTLRMLQIDGADQFASGYTAMGNNPVNMIDPDGQVAAPVIIGGVMGGLSGWQLGKSKGVTGWKMAGYIAGGIAIGALSAGFANSILTSGIAYANTASIIGGSFVNSIGMNILSGGSSPINVSFGVGSYDVTNNDFGYLFEKGNSKLQNWGYAFGAMANIQDIMAGTNGTTIDVKSRPKIAGHSESSGCYGECPINISVGPNENQIIDNTTDGLKWELQFGKATLKGNSMNGENVSYIRPEHPQIVTKLNNVSGKRLSNMTDRLNSGRNLIGTNRLKYGLLYGCVNFNARALFGAGVFNLNALLPVTAPVLLNAELALRNIGMSVASFMILKY